MNNVRTSDEKRQGLGMGRGMLLVWALMITSVIVPYMFRNGFEAIYVQRVMVAQDARQAEGAVTLLLEHLEAHDLTHGSTSLNAADRNLEHWYEDLRRVRSELHHAVYESHSNRDQSSALYHAHQVAARLPHWLRMYPHQRAYLVAVLSGIVIMLLTAWRARPVSDSRQPAIS